MKIECAFRDHIFTESLYDNPSARDFASMLPIDLRVQCSSLSQPNSWCRHLHLSAVVIITIDHPHRPQAGVPFLSAQKFSLFNNRRVPIPSRLHAASAECHPAMRLPGCPVQDRRRHSAHDVCEMRVRAAHSPVLPRHGGLDGRCVAF
jgi:hypothetical protein